MKRNLIISSLLTLGLIACGGDEQKTTTDNNNNQTINNGSDSSSDKDNDTNKVVVMKDADNNEYATVTIGDQIWTKTNIKQKSDVSCIIDTESDESDFDPNFYDKYGCLYNFADAQKVCANGWHLPTKADFEKLLAYADEHKTSTDIGFALAAKSSEWYGIDLDAVSSMDDFGFGALPGGSHYISPFDGTGHLSHVGSEANFWSSTPRDDDDEQHVSLYIDFVASEGEAYIDSWYDDNGLSVRCIKD